MYEKVNWSKSELEDEILFLEKQLQEEKSKHSEQDELVSGKAFVFEETVGKRKLLNFKKLILYWLKYYICSEKSKNTESYKVESKNFQIH